MWKPSTGRRRLIALAAIAIASSSQAAPTIWRCGNNYSDQPCDNAKAIEAEPAPSAERRRQADEGTRRDMQAAERMERERLRLEASQAHNRAVLIDRPPRDPARPAPPPTLLKPSKKKMGPPDAFVASSAAPADPDKKKKKKKPKPAAD